MDQGLTTKKSFWSTVHGPWSMVLLLLLACSKPSSPTLAVVNDQKVTVADFQKAMDWEQWKYGGEVGFTAERLETFKRQSLDALLRETLLLQEALRRGITVPQTEIDQAFERIKKHYPKEGDFEKLLEVKGLDLDDLKELRKKELTVKKLMEQVAAEELNVTDENLKKYYDAHLAEFRHGERVRARQMVTDSREKADALKAMLDGGALFEEVAQKHSLSPDGKNGGDLGWFEKGTMPEEFDRVCFRLKTGQTSDVVKTPYGYHIFRVLERSPPGLTAFDAVREDIRRQLVQENGAQVFQKWYQQLQTTARIEVKQEVLEGIK
ncbi:MAG: peptidyl-prolyl cis-trans isomerase [Deltaproteobacteria bacterium]|nr:peptidyl-prolyl cis-trans isomerase [Deltaproteobacteria bacterium]